MAVYIKIDDPARYYQPTLVTDAATDKVDEIAVGSNGGGKGYIVDSGAQDTPMSLVAGERKLAEVSQGFCYLLGSFSGVWAGAGQVKLKLVDASNRVFLREFLTDNPLSSYEYAVYLAIMDNAGNIVDKELQHGTQVYDSSIGKYKHTFSLSASELTFGTTESETALRDLSKVYVYLRGYFYEATAGKQIDYIGAGIELDSAGGTVPFALRGFAGLGWRFGSGTLPTDITATKTSGLFPSGADFMPKTETINLTLASYNNSGIAMRALALAVVRTTGTATATDYIPISQKSQLAGSLSFSMRTIRYKSPKARTAVLWIYASNGHSWSIMGTPSFVTADVSSGSGTESKVTLTFTENTSGQARQGTLSVIDTTANQYYYIPVVQLATERFEAAYEYVPDGSGGTKKTIAAYAATVAKTAFDLEVAYYNAPEFTLYLRQLGFNIADFAAGTNGIGTLNMKSGKCAGRDFNITGCAYDPTHDRWQLTLDRLEDSSVGMVFPNITYPIEAGDRFVLTDILMPEVYIIVAGKKLLARARVYYDQHSKLKYLYDLEIDSKWIHGQTGVYLRPGMYMQIADSDLIGANPEYVLIDTVTITENESNIPTFKVTLREKLYLPE